MLQIEDSCLLMKRVLKFKGLKRESHKRLILKMLDIFEQIGLNLDGFSDRRLEMMAMVTLTVAGIKRSFKEARDASCKMPMKTREIIECLNKRFGENISSGSYDDIRRKYLIAQVEFGCIVNSSLAEKKATNDPTRGYSVSASFAKLLRIYGTKDWQAALMLYKSQCRSEVEQSRKVQSEFSIRVEVSRGEFISLSLGQHNELQKLIVEQFLLRFGLGAKVLYIGDTLNKQLYVKQTDLENIGFFRLAHEELPDVVALSSENNLLYLIEAVYSSCPMDEVRVNRLKRKLTHCQATPIFISAFLSRKAFRRFISDIAWETEVWPADEPDHLIHLNGYKFLEIHRGKE